jgi:hypothetical protein
MHHEQQVQNSGDTVYPRNMVCFRYISVNTLHNGDDDDDDTSTSYAVRSTHRSK